VLLFKKKYLDAIRSGQKTQTIRLWQHCRMRSGQRSYIPGAGYIQVTAVEPVHLAELTDEDALLDGFTSSDALQTELAELYAAEFACGFQAYRIRFEVLRAEAQNAVKSKRKQK
jgi:hypothetical protein